MLEPCHSGPRDLRAARRGEDVCLVEMEDDLVSVEGVREEVGDLPGRGRLDAEVVELVLKVPALDVEDTGEAVSLGPFHAREHRRDGAEEVREVPDRPS